MFEKTVIVVIVVIIFGLIFIVLMFVSVIGRIFGRTSDTFSAPRFRTVFHLNGSTNGVRINKIRHQFRIVRTRRFLIWNAT